MFSNNNKELNIDREKISYFVSIFSLVGLILSSTLYLYFLNSSVMNVILREKYNGAISNMTPQVSSLENKYMQVKNSINMDMAKGLGYVDDFNNVHFSTENDNLNGSLSVLSNEIR